MTEGDIFIVELFQKFRFFNLSFLNISNNNISSIGLTLTLQSDNLLELTTLICRDNKVRILSYKVKKVLTSGITTREQENVVVQMSKFIVQEFDI